MIRFPKLRIPMTETAKANTVGPAPAPADPQASRGQATTPSPRGAPPLAAVRVGHDQPPATGQSRDVHARSQTKSELRTRPAMRRRKEGEEGLPKCGHCLSYLFS
jgi:hypothetical protein